MRNISNGETSLDVLKRRNDLRQNNSFIPGLSGLFSRSYTSITPSRSTPYIWVPRAIFTDSESVSLPEPFSGTALHVKPDQRLYDLGKENNWVRWRALVRGEYNLGEPRNDQCVAGFFR